eukprot:GHRR01006414.1.p1 GENE.GHRR01006414.1~~GHRR01006414.1.p1  ORF type:complete len:198 (+),score=67.38 GHRR01006414.1:105-698(+)
MLTMHCLRGIRACVASSAHNLGFPAAMQGGHPVRQLRTSIYCSADASQLSARIKGDMKTALKARDIARLEAIRFLNAAIKQREIELREKGQQVSDTDVLGVIQKLAKQRTDSIEQYKAGGRDDLVNKEQQELHVLQSYLPAQLSREELTKIVQEVVAETGANSVKQMGQVMKALMAKTVGQADNKMVSDLVKAALQQ